MIRLAPGLAAFKKKKKVQ